MDDFASISISGLEKKNKRERERRGITIMSQNCNDLISRLNFLFWLEALFKNLKKKSKSEVKEEKELADKIGTKLMKVLKEIVLN